MHTVIRDHPEWFSTVTRIHAAAEGKGGGGGGTTTSTTVVNVPGKTSEEIELDKINLEIAKSQREQLRVQGAFENAEAVLASNLAGFEDLDTPTFRGQLEQAAKDRTEQRSFTELINRQLKGRLTGEAFLTPTEQSTLDKLYGSAQARGEEDLLKFGEEISSQRGLRPSDSPIGNELVRERGRLALGLESAKASSTLDLVQGQKNFEESIRQFQEGLRQQAFENRLSLASAAPLSFNLANQLAQNRFRGISQTSSGQTSLTPGIGQIGGAIGGAGIGLGMLLGKGG